ncbi:DUF998 domain-containing protein [Nonomuraea sp. NPDC048826]|uniref:DUF998 domain-containing protein n=1 Tax=Nonomuraea sp. NPDC048826 TaxID=3364347 RepID=UPI00371F5F5D
MTRPRLALALGPLAAALFIAVATFEAFTRPAFDLTRHAISMLSLGDRGWVMAADFVVSGILVIALATGLRGARAGRPGAVAGPVLTAVFGVGLILAGIFPAPAGLGFPAGTPQDLQPVMTTTAIMHSVAFNIAFTSLIAATFVYGRAYGRDRARAWQIASIAVGVALPVLIVAGMAVLIPTGVAFYAAAVLAWLWLAAVALEHAKRVPPAGQAGAEAREAASALRV